MKKAMKKLRAFGPIVLWTITGMRAGTPPRCLTRGRRLSLKTRKEMMKKLLIPVVASAAVVLAAPAHADNQGFLNYMQNHGYTSTVSGNGYSYVDQGQQVCQALQNGASESSQIGRLEGLMSRAESGLVVTGARQYLCPGT